MAPVSVGVAFYAGFNLEGPAQRFIVAAALVYGTTSFLVTIFGNVPMNKRLDRIDAASAGAADYSRTYGAVWTRWNHVRMISSLATAGCYLAAAIVLA